MKTLAIIVAISAHAAIVTATPARHVPPGSVEVGTPVELVVDAPAAIPTLVAHVRTRGQTAFRTLELVRRDDPHWVAIVPATDVIEPGFEYFIDAGGQEIFASAAAPYTVEVVASEDLARRRRDQARSGGRRSRIHTMGEWVDYGTTTVNGVRLVDRYYRFDADFSYKLWAYPLEELRVGYTRLIGDTEAPAGTACLGGATACTQQAGFKVGGWFELGTAPIEGIRFDGRAMVIATQQGFNLGARAEARVGVIDGNHVALGFEYLADVGSNGFFRLGWATVPRTPMTATVEITNLPATSSETGVRLYYDVARDLGNGVKLGVRVGYAARVSSVVGFTGGASASVDF